jgi:DNA-binding beta-propeller fold protein YncE
MKTCNLIKLGLFALMLSAKCVAAGQPYIYFICQLSIQDGSSSIQAFKATPTGTKAQPSTDPATPISTTLNGKACYYLKKNGFSQNTGYAMSNPTVQSVLNGAKARSGQMAAQTSAASTTQTTQLNTFPFMVPLPFPPQVGIPSSATSGNCDGTIGFYVVEHDTSTVEHISACPFQSVKTLQPCLEPKEQALTPDGSTLLVSCYDSKVVWIDTNTDTITNTLSSSTFLGAGIAVSPDGSTAYVTNYNDVSPNPSIVVIDMASKSIRTSFPLLRAFPGVLVLTPDGSQAWVNYYQNSYVDVIDTQTGALVGSIDFQADTENEMKFNSTGTRAFVAIGGANQLGVVNTTTLQIIARVNVVDQPAMVSYNPDEQVVTVGSASTAALSRVDAVANTLIETVNYPNGGVLGIALLLGSLAIH